ncbi:hypothetical protein ONZ45_g9809 [Pleurotus djamor]|nr:hypothetical protein ONZ45_g9809 [Pleurotus djamor]
MDFEFSPYMSLDSRSHNVQDTPLEELQFLDPYKPEDYDCERRVFKQDVENSRTPHQRNRSDPLAAQPAQTVFTGVDVKDQCAVVALLNLKYNTNFETGEGIWRPELIEELEEMGMKVERPKFKQRPVVRKKEQIGRAVTR